MVAKSRRWRPRRTPLLTGRHARIAGPGEQRDDCGTIFILIEQGGKTGGMETYLGNLFGHGARLVNIYGWNAQNKQSLAEWVLGLLDQGSDVPGFTDVFFTPILVNDLAPILLTMLQQKFSGLYHVAGSERISKFEFARRVAAAFGSDPARVKPCRIKDRRLRAARPLDVSLDTKKITAVLGCPMPDVDSGLSKFRELRDRKYPQQLKKYLLEGSR